MTAHPSPPNEPLIERTGEEVAGKVSSKGPSDSSPSLSTVSTWVLLSYGALAMPMSMALTPIITYLPAYYSQDLRLDAGLVGAALLLARLWDGLFDVIIGWLSDRTTSRFGRRKFWVVLAAPSLVASSWLLCNPPADVGWLYLTVCAALFYTAWTAMEIPYLSWGTELSSDYVERNRVTSFREAFMMLGSLFFASAPLLFFSGEAALHEVLWLISVMLLWMIPAAVVPLSVFVADPPIARAPQIPLFRGMAFLVNDRAMVRFVAAILMIYIGEGVINSLVIFSLDVGIGLPGKIFWIIFIIYVTTICFLPLALQLGKRVEKHWLLIAGLTIKAIGFAAHVFIPAGNFQIIVVLWVVIGIGHTFVVVLPTSILADIIDNAEVEDRSRRPGAYVAIFNLALKVGMALGVGLAFGSLELLNYDPSATSHGPSDASNIRLLGFGLPASLLLPAIVLFLGHKITKEVQQQLRRVIESRAVRSEN